MDQLMPDLTTHQAALIKAAERCAFADRAVRQADQRMQETSDARATAARDLHTIQRAAGEAWQRLHDLALGIEDATISSE